MPNLINQLSVRSLDKAFGEAEGMVFVSLAGLTVQETEVLRNSLAEKDVQLTMVRNRLAELAMKNAGYELPQGLLVGNIGCCWGDVERTIAAAKVLSSSPHKKTGKVVLKGGMLDGAVLTESETNALADLPGRDELRAMMLGAISGPARKLVGLIAAPGGALARVIQAHVDASQESA